MPSFSRSAPWFLAAVLFAACGPESVGEISGEEDEGLEFTLAELNGTFVVQLVNSADATLELLTQSVHLEVRAAKNLVAFRAGADGVAGTPDDQAFTTLAQVDAVPYVGATALTRLDAFATARYGAVGVTVEGVAFTVSEAADAVAAVNGTHLMEIGFTPTAYGSLNLHRPFASVSAIGAASGVGSGALTTLRNYVRAHAGTVTPPATACVGGTFDGVAFTAVEACHAVDFLNHARFSEMGALPDGARLVAYELGPDGRLAATRGANWATVAQYAGLAGIGPTAINGLKTGAATWAANGSSVDTVANTWTHRADLLGMPVYLERAYVTKVLPQQGDDGSYLWECAELRDAPGAPNFVLGCKPSVVCGGFCWDNAPVGTWVTRVHGTVKHSSIAGSGGFRISLSN